MTQKEEVLMHLKKHGEITSWDGIVLYGITRVAAWICQLRKEGYEIISHNVTVKKGERTINFTRYELKK